MSTSTRKQAEKRAERSREIKSYLADTLDRYADAERRHVEWDEWTQRAADHFDEWSTAHTHASATLIALATALLRDERSRLWTAGRARDRQDRLASRVETLDMRGYQIRVVVDQLYQIAYALYRRDVDGRVVRVSGVAPQRTLDELVEIAERL